MFKITLKKVIVWCQTKVAKKFKTRSLQTKKKPKKFKKELKHSRKVQECPKKNLTKFLENFSKKIIEHCHKNARKWQKAQEKTQ